MCVQLRQIYDKKSPIFLIQIYILTATSILISSYPSPICQPSLSAFYRLVIIVSSLQIVFKTIILAIIQAVNKQLSKAVQNVLVGIFIVCHLALWIFSIILYQGQSMEECKEQEPHYFYVKTYMYLNGILMIGSLILLLVLLFPVAMITLFSLKKKPQNEESE